MKKLLSLLPALLLFLPFSFSQNVGVGTSTPAHPLDVVGNINTTGNILVNGVAGSNGQVLTMNGNTMQWMDKSRYNNWAIFASTGASSFAVPAGITEVLIEMWGAGGGGHNPGGGGGSGGYWVGKVPVTGISSISLSIGVGGNAGSGNTTAGNGGNTSFTCTGFNVTTGGGEGADTIDVSLETYIPGTGGAGIVSGSSLPPTYRNYFFANGNNGSPTEINYIQTAAGVFSRLRKGGVGGVAPYSGLQPRPATYYLELPAQNVRTGFTSASAADFGGGGTPLIGNNGSNGGHGRVIIYY